MNFLTKTAICLGMIVVSFDAQGHDEPVISYKAAAKPMRNYNIPLTSREKKEITYIIDTLGNSSLIAIARAKASIEQSGETVDHVHPLLFLHHIFSNEKLKAAVHNMQSRSWVWGRFFKGIKGGLDEELNRNNLFPHLDDFCKRLKINPAIFFPLAQKGQWKEFVEALIKQIPRSETSGRYDM